MYTCTQEGYVHRGAMYTGSMYRKAVLCTQQSLFYVHSIYILMTRYGEDCQNCGTKGATLKVIARGAKKNIGLGRYCPVCGTLIINAECKIQEEIP
jgi:hypothetical protein